MRILILTKTVKPDSGWGRYSIEISKEYTNMGLAHTVLSEDRDGLDKSTSNLYPSSSLSNILKNALMTRRAAKDFDIVHAFDGWPMLIYGFFAVLGTSKKLFSLGIGTYSVAPRNWSLKRILMILAYRRTEKVMCISRYTEERVRTSTPFSKTSVVHLGSTPLPKLSRQELSQMRIQMNIPQSDSPIIVTVGAIKERKGQLDTLKAIALLKKKYSKIVYIMLGSNEDDGYISSINQYALENNLENNIKILTNIKTDADLAFFYAISDVITLNSNNDLNSNHFEGFGLVILEAAQFGVPAVGSRGCGIEDAIIDGYNGFLVPQKDVYHIAEAINKALIEQASLSLNAREFYTRFSWRKTASSYVSAYRESLT